MKTNTFKICLIAVTLLTCSASYGDAVTYGKELHDANCTSCHKSDIYKREDRSVTSMDKLKSQIQRCRHTLDMSWSDEQITSVVDYLNQEYYQFK